MSSSERNNTLTLTAKELLDASPKTALQHQTEVLLRSAAYTGLQAPVSAVTQLFDGGLGTHWTEATSFIAAPESAAPWSGDWHLQQVGNAAGMILPFLGLKYGLSKVFRSPLTEAAIASGQQSLTREEMRMLAQYEVRLTIATGAVYGGFLTPTKPEEGDLLGARLNHAASSALTFGALGYGTMGIRGVGASKYLKGSVVGSILRNDIAATMLAGLPAGVVAADSHSLLAGKGFATMDQRLQSAYSFTMVGGLLSVGQKGVETISGGKGTVTEAVPEPIISDTGRPAGPLPARTGVPKPDAPAVKPGAGEPGGSGLSAEVRLAREQGPVRDNGGAPQLQLERDLLAPSRTVPELQPKAPEASPPAVVSYAKMMGDFQRRVATGELVIPEVPKVTESSRPVTYQTRVQKMPRLKPAEQRPTEAPLDPAEYRHTFIDEVSEPVRVYTKEGLATELIVPESYAAKLDRFAELKAKTARGGPEGDRAAAELRTPAMRELEGMLTPAEALSLIERTPAPNLFKQVTLSPEANPFDPWFQRRLSDSEFKSNADSLLGKGETGLYQRRNDATVVEDLMHEFAHHFEGAQPLEAGLFHIARRLEGWTPRPYASTPRENWAVLTGEYALAGNKAQVLTLIQKAPIRAALIGEAMYQRLSQLPPGERGPLFDFYMERAQLLRSEAGPIAKQKLAEVAAKAPLAKAGQNALKLLLFIGEPGHFQQIGRVPKLDLSFETTVGNTEVGRLSLLRGLEDVDLSHTNATTDGVVQLQPLSLTHLGLRGTQFHDYGVPSLPPRLRVLDLSKTQVTDGAVPHLANLKDLLKLNVSDSKITADGLKTLRRVLPSTEIEH